MMLWFKNLLIYRLNRDTTFSIEEIEKQLEGLIFTPCGSQDMTRTGWVSPLGAYSDALTHVANGQILLCVRKEEKILPTPVIKQTHQAKIEQLEGEQHRKLKKNEKEALKEEIIHQLLPRAFSRFSHTWLWIDTINQRIIVDAASSKRAEDALALLRKSIGSLPVTPLMLEKPVELTMTEWVRSGHLPTGWVLQDEVELKATLEEGGVVRCKKQDLLSDEITTHIEAGKRVTKLALEWQERVQLILAEDNSLKRLKFSDLLREQHADIDKVDFAQRFDADFILMTSELTTLISTLIANLGGEAQR